MFRRLINTSYLLGGDLLTLALVDLWPRRRVDIGCCCWYMSWKKYYYVLRC